MLVILWKFGATTAPGCITRSEFLSGMESNYIADVAALKSSLYVFETGFLEATGFLKQFTIFLWISTKIVHTH